MSFDRSDPAQLEWLYKELAGILTGGEDPAQPSTGSQADTYGYRAGNGTSLPEKLDLYIKIQENGTGRPITVTRRSESGPGKVVEPLFAQEFQERIDRIEMHAVKQLPETNQERTDWDFVYAMFISADPNALWAYTDEIEGLLLAIFDNSNWPSTRANLINMLQQPGSRSQEQSGVQVVQADLEAAEQWRAQNMPGSPSLYT